MQVCSLINCGSLYDAFRGDPKPGVCRRRLEDDVSIVVGH